MRTLLVAMLLAASCPGPAHADPAPLPASHAKRPIAVMAGDDEAFAQALRAELLDLGRFIPLAGVESTPSEPLPRYLQRVASAAANAGLGDGPAYVFVPKRRFGTITLGAPQTKDELRNGVLQSTVYTELSCRMRLEVDVYEAPSGRSIGTLSGEQALSRRFEYQYDQHTPDATIRSKAQALTSRLNLEASQPPALAFADQARREMGNLLPDLLMDVRQLGPFQLQGGVTGWSAPRDRIFLDLGEDFKLRPDDGFKLYQGEREIGFVKIRQVEAGRSEAAPVFLDGTLRLGDRLVEHPKHNNWQGLKIGALWMGGPALIGTYSGEWDIGRFFNWSELYATLDGSLLNNGLVSGRLGEVGLTQKHFYRRWGLHYGLKGGLVSITGLTGEAHAPGGALVGGLNCYLTPDIAWTVDTGFEAYLPIRQSGGSQDGRLIQPFGPLLRTGLSVWF